MSGARDPLTLALIRLADGDRAAFDVVYRQAEPRVRGLAGRLLVGTPEADDAAQRALIRVFERASSFDPERGAAMPWILGIAAWECRTVRRRWSRSRELTGVEQEREDPAASVEDRLVDVELEWALNAVIDGLDPTDRQTLRASMDQCERPAISGPAFRKRLQRAMSRLRQAWSTAHE